MNDINYYGKTIYYIIIYIIVITSIIIIIDEIIKMTRFCYNYTYNYNYGNINENLCQNDENTGIIEYEKARFRVLNNINKYKFENDIFNKTWINYIKYLIVIILTIIAFLIFGTIFYYFFIDKIKNCENDIENESDMSAIKLLIKCTFGDLHKFIPNCTINYLLVFLIVVYYPLIILLKSFLNLDLTWTGGYWSKGFHISVSILLFLYIILLLREKNKENKENTVTVKDKYLKVLIYISFIGVFYLSQYIYNDAYDEYNNQFKESNIYNNENDKNDTMFFDIYKQQEPLKPSKSDILLNLPRDSNNSNLLLTFKYCSPSELALATKPPYCADNYNLNLEQINKYYEEKKEYEEKLKNYTNKYNIYKYNKIEFPEIITIFNSFIPTFLGFNKKIFIIIYIFIAIYALILGIIKFYNSNYADYYYNTIIIYLIGLISIYILINSLLNYNTFFNKFHIYEPLAFYKYDIYKMNILFDLAIKNTQTNTDYINKLEFYQKITGKDYKQTYTDVVSSVTDINDLIKDIKNNSYLVSDLTNFKAIPTDSIATLLALITTTKTTHDATKVAYDVAKSEYVKKTAYEAAKIAYEAAEPNFNNRVLYLKLINAIYIGLYSSLLYLKDINATDYATKYIATNTKYWTDGNINNKFDFYYPNIFTLLNSSSLETSTADKLLTADFYNFIQIIKGTAVNNTNTIDSKINRIINNIKYLIYSETDPDVLVHLNNKLALSLSLSNATLYSHYLLKEDVSDTLLESLMQPPKNNSLIKTYEYNIGTIKEITYYYSEFLIKVRSIVIKLLNSSSVYCNTESDDINIMQKLNDYIAVMTKNNMKKFKIPTEEPNINIYKKILESSINEFNTIYRNYFNIIKVIIYKNIKNYSDKPSDNLSLNIFREVLNNYNVHNINDNKYNKEDFINNLSIILKDKEYITKYKNLNSKDKEILNLNIDSVSWGFIVLVIIFAIILLEPIII
jgi:hypothetical protein